MALPHDEIMRILVKLANNKTPEAECEQMIRQLLRSVPLWWSDDTKGKASTIRFMEDFVIEVYKSGRREIFPFLYPVFAFFCGPKGPCGVELSVDWTILDKFLAPIREALQKK